MRFIPTILLSTAVLISSYAEEKISNYHLAIGVSAGGSYSHIKADKLMEHYFSPTEGTTKQTSPSCGVNVDFYAGRFAAVSSGLVYLKLGQYSKKTNIYYRDSPFEHELSTSSLVDYVGVPIILKGGINLSHMTFFVRGGIIPLYKMKESISWTVDDKELLVGDRRPYVEINQWNQLATVGAEGGVWLGDNGIFLSVDYSYGTQSFAKGIEGDALHRAAVVYLKYVMRIF